MSRRLAACLLLVALAAAPLHAANRLAGATSPYLRQHADNPVDWYPWGEEAFAKAKREGKPIFLSIGYSTCHWCHVMNQESFSDPEVAAALNPAFVSIKVDREERPDVDAVYIAAARAMTGEAGWPLTVVLTPERKPFFAATYVPKDRLLDILPKLARAWSEQREKVAASANLVAGSLRESAPEKALPLGRKDLDAAYRELAAQFDPRNGGFGPPPKFPSPQNLVFLLRYWKRTGEKEALERVQTTLRGMTRGGLLDPVESGFHRYAQKADWSDPHFEKMLYDQALMVIVYCEAFQATHKAEYAQTARKVLGWVLRDLRAPGGGFYSARDADARYYATKERSKLAKPARDEKILTDWNGLMIAALAKGAMVLDDPAYAQAAKQAADFILKNNRRADGRLLHHASIPAYLDDYAFLTAGLLDLYEATGDIRRLETAIALQTEALRLFPADDGTFFLTARDAEELLARPRELRDGATPSGNAVTLANLLRLDRITMRKDFAAAATHLISGAASAVRAEPSSSPQLLAAVDFALGPSFEVVLSGADTAKLRRAVFAGFVPNKVVVHRPPGKEPPIVRLAPFTKFQTAGRRGATAYVCSNHECRLPTSDPKKVRELLHE